MYNLKQIWVMPRRYRKMLLRWHQHQLNLFDPFLR